MRKVGPTPAGFLWLVLCLWLLATRSSAAATLPGAELTLSRSSAAASCPNEDVVAKELSRRLAPRRPSRQPLLLRVELDAQGTAFTARILVLGRRQGERSLSAEGPGCEPLRDVLVVSLLLLLDDDAESDAPEDAPLAPIPKPVAIWLTGGGAVTHGLPLGWSSAWYAELSLRLPTLEFALGGLWAPDRRVDFSPGSVTLQILGARAHGCYVVRVNELGFGGCLFGVLASLHGRGDSFTSNVSASRPWFLIGAGPELRWSLLPRLSLGVSGQALVSPFRESFSIQNLPGNAYRSDRWLAWLGVDLSARLW